MMGWRRTMLNSHRYWRLSDERTLEVDDLTTDFLIYSPTARPQPIDSLYLNLPASGSALFGVYPVTIWSCLCSLGLCCCYEGIWC